MLTVDGVSASMPGSTMSATCSDAAKGNGNLRGLHVRLQAKDALMDLAVQLAVTSWPAASDAASVLGALELAKLCGLKPQVHAPSLEQHT
jgi:hypothetical protein